MPSGKGAGAGRTAALLAGLALLVPACGPAGSPPEPADPVGAKPADPVGAKPVDPVGAKPARVLGAEPADPAGAPPVPVACEDPRPELCAQVYDPVCATRDTGVRCVTTPCDSTETREYPSGCDACSDPKVLSYVAGRCPP